MSQKELLVKIWNLITDIQVNLLMRLKRRLENVERNEMESAESLETNDAQVWGREFERCKKKNNWTLDDIDKDLMVAWFANAMAAQEFADQRRKDA